MRARRASWYNEGEQLRGPNFSIDLLKCHSFIIIFIMFMSFVFYDVTVVHYMSEFAYRRHGFEL